MDLQDKDFTSWRANMSDPDKLTLIYQLLGPDCINQALYAHWLSHLDEPTQTNETSTALAVLEAHFYYIATRYSSTPISVSAKSLIKVLDANGLFICRREPPE